MFDIVRHGNGKTPGASLEVHFQGSAVEDHSMDVRVLAPALLALSDALDRYRDFVDPMMELDVKICDVKEGSFAVFLQLLGSAVSLMQAFGADDLTKLASGLLDVLKIIGARFRESGDVKPLHHEVVKQTRTKVELKIGPTSLKVSRQTYQASCDGHLINSLGAASQPSTLAGYDDVRFIQPRSGRVEVMGKRESQACTDLVMDDERLPDRVEHTRLQIDTIQMNSRKWKFYDGKDHFWCEITDEGFLTRWDRGEIPFTRGDTLDVTLHTELYMRDGRLCIGKRRIVEIFNDEAEFEQPTLGID
ncbi:hypothetical protein [Bifidobacterium pseudolongum]|nr:hypothetical protein [Bifidobacterium pseudolongum]